MILRPMYDFRLIFMSANACIHTIVKPSTLFSASIAVGTLGGSLVPTGSHTRNLQLVGCSFGASHRSAEENR